MPFAPRLHPRHLLGLGAAALALAAAPAAATDTAFSATINTQEVLFLVPTSVCPANIAGITTGLGQATLLGRVALKATDCVVPDLQTGAMRFVNGKLTLVGITGELLFANYTGTAVPTGGTTLTLQGNFTVTGGTGRFRRASGTGTLSGSEDMQTLRGQLIANGVIHH